MNTNALPAEAVSMYNRALEKTNMGDLSTAITEYQQAIKMYPYFIEAYNNMGEIYSILGKTELAISTYNKALDIEKNHKVLLNIGVEYYNAGNYYYALDYFLESLKEKTDFHEGNYYTGLTYYNLKKYKAAESYLKRVVDQDRKHIKANYMLSYIYYERKEYARVIECLNAIWEIADDKSFINRYYGFCCFHMGQYQRAAGYLKEAVANHPEYNRFKSYLENLTYENKVKEIGDVDAAIRQLEDMMMKQSPQLSDITRLSMLYVFKGDNRKAEQIVVDFKKRITTPKR